MTQCLLQHTESAAVSTMPLCVYEFYCACLHHLLPVFVQAGVLCILRCRCQVKSQESPQYVRTASTTVNLVTAKMLMSSLMTSNLGTATHAMATARATVAAPAAMMHWCLSQRKGCSNAAGRDSKLNWNSLWAADTSTEES